MPGLWPTEAAWKLKVEIKRTEGFRQEEIFMFNHVPLGALDRTNTIAWSTNVAGLTVTLPEQKPNDYAYGLKINVG